MKRKKLFFAKLIVFAFFIIILVSFINILIWYYDNRENDKIKEEIEKNIVHEVSSLDEKNKEKIYQIDFENLKKMNSDTVAYFKLRGTNIDFVVVKGNDNSYYLNHNFNKEYNRSGWIFMDYRNRLDGTDKNIIIYGHNTWDGSMFGSLKQVVTEEWFQNKENFLISLETENKIFKYQVFSTYIINVEDYYITTDFESDYEYRKFLTVLKNRSFFDYSIDISHSDAILTLSTCTGNGKKRVVLHAVKIS